MSKLTLRLHLKHCILKGFKKNTDNKMEDIKRILSKG